MKIAPKKTAFGKAMLPGMGFKPFVFPREISRGKKKGWFEIFLTRGRKNGRIVVGKKKVVPRKHITKFPDDFRDPPRQIALFV